MKKKLPDYRETWKEERVTRKQQINTARLRNDSCQTRQREIERTHQREKERTHQRETERTHQRIRKKGRRNTRTGTRQRTWNFIVVPRSFSFGDSHNQSDSRHLVMTKWEKQQKPLRLPREHKHQPTPSPWLQVQRDALKRPRYWLDLLKCIVNINSKILIDY